MVRLVPQCGGLAMFAVIIFGLIACSSSRAAAAGLNCSIDSNSTKSNVCGAFVIFFRAPNQSLTEIAKLFNDTTVNDITNENANANATISETSSSPLFIPVGCSCNNGTYSAIFEYTVMPGDSMFRIAETTYQNLASGNGVVQANPEVSVPSMIQPGQKLRVPIACGCGANRTYVTYSVQANDSAASIANITQATEMDVVSAGYIEQTANITQPGNITQTMNSTKPGTVLVFPTSRPAPRLTKSRARGARDLFAGVLTIMALAAAVTSSLII